MLVAVATVAAGVAIHAVDGGLGVPTPPFVADWAPRLHPLAAVSVLAGALACAAGPRLLAARLPPVAFAAAVYVLALGLGLAVGLERTGPAGWTAMLDLARPGEAANEYLAGLPSTGYGLRFYLDRFAELVPAQPVHVAGHPPGPLLLMGALGIRGADGLAALCIGGGAVAAPLTYALGRTLGRGESGARLAALLFACSPVVLLFGVTSYDYLFAALGTAAATLLVAPRRWVRGAGAAALAGAALFAWSLLGVGAWAAIVVARRDGLRAAAMLAAACAAAVAALNGALAAAYGYDPVGTLAATAGVYRDGIASIRPYAFWVLGSPVAWGVMLGIPIAAGAIRGAVRGDTPAVALAAVIVAAAVGGFTKAETERIWLFLAPLACVAAVPALAGRRPERLLALLVAHALVVQALSATVW
jgi:hypothetical protein